MRSENKGGRKGKAGVKEERSGRRMRTGMSVRVWESHVVFVPSLVPPVMARKGMACGLFLLDIFSIISHYCSTSEFILID